MTIGGDNIINYNFSYILTLGSVQCSLITVFLYMFPLHKKKQFVLRFISCVVISLLIAPLIKMYQSYTANIFCNTTSSIKSFLGVIFGIGGDLSFNLLLICFVVYVCCKIEWNKAFYCSICAYLTQDIAYTIFVIIMPNSANRGAKTINPNTLWLELLIMALIYSFFFLFFAQKLPENGEYKFNCNRSLPAMLSIIYIGRIIGTYAKKSFDSQDNNIFSFMLIYDVLLSVTLLVTQLILQKEDSYRTAMAIETQLRLTQKRQYEIFRENIDAINHKCHDLKHLVSALKIETDSSRKKELLHELEQDIMIYDAHMDTGNDILDTLLSEIWVNCYHKNIQWTCMADGNALKFLDAIDLYTLLGNALENAVENTSQVSNTQKRFLCVNIWKKERMAFIKIENYCEDIPNFYDGIPITTKKNSLEHGYGMRSIQTVVNRYDGEWKVTIKDNIFTINIMLPIPMNIKNQKI